VFAVSATPGRFPTTPGVSATPTFLTFLLHLFKLLPLLWTQQRGNARVAIADHLADAFEPLPAQRVNLFGTAPDDGFDSLDLLRIQIQFGLEMVTPESGNLSRARGGEHSLLYCFGGHYPTRHTSCTKDSG
jgi:hypothetical protein